MLKEIVFEQNRDVGGKITISDGTKFDKLVSGGCVPLKIEIIDEGDDIVVRYGDNVYDSIALAVLKAVYLETLLWVGGVTREECEKIWNEEVTGKEQVENK